MAESQTVIFNRAVNFVLPRVIPTHFARSSEFSLGDVLVYEKKLKPLMPWRKHRLVVADCNISKLLEEPLDGLTQSTEVVFDNANTSRTLGVDASVDAQIQYAVAARFGIHVADAEKATMSVDFGKVERHFTNLKELLVNHNKKLKVNRSHPIIQDASKNNKTLFIITSLYVSEKANVQLTFTASAKDDEDDKDKATTNTGCTTTVTTCPPTQQPPYQQPPPVPPPVQPPSNPPATQPSDPLAITKPVVGGDIEFDITQGGTSMVQRTEPTNIGYRVMRMTFDRNGMLTPKVRAGIKYARVKLMDETDYTDPLESCEYTHNLEDVIAAREEED